MKPKLSIILPGIRQYNWDAVYNSINLDFKWELIIVSPYQLTDRLQNSRNVKHIRDWGSPARASCIGASLCEAKYITWIADDGICISGTIEKSIKTLDANINGRLVIVTKYLEACEKVHNDDYYKLVNAYPKSPYISDSWWIFNCAFMHRDYYESIGGWDAENFETPAILHADLAIRCQRDGCETILIEDPLLNCGHGHADHAPIEMAHNYNDAPRYSEIYNSIDCLHRTKININNWKNSPAIWERRFK